MADDISASVITLHQPRPKKAKTGAERARAYRERKKVATVPEGPACDATPADRKAVEESTTRTGKEVETVSITPTNHTSTVTPIPHPTVTPFTLTPSRGSAAPIILMAAALGLAGVGVTQNAWYARSLGATETAGMLFLILGTASDMAALVMPSVAARAWQARQPGVALAGWMVWLATFVFANMAGIGFASTNIADVTMVRASRETPAVTAAQTALSDAMATRDRECKGGVGKYCREREQAVVDRRQALDAAMQAMAQTADPQAVAAVKLVSWVTAGAISPSENDFSMLRLMLLCLLPQLAGVLLMVGVRSRPRPPFTTGRRDLRSGSAL
jgi:hypothetical protein